jgi:hypothetical protein
MIKNFFQIKKHKFYINGVEEFIPTEEVMVSALRGPSWFRQLCPFLGKNKTPLEAYNKGRLPIQRTAQNCPAILELFKNSFLIKFPCDLILETMETGDYRWQKPSKTKVLTITHQTDDQIESTGPLASCIIIKFCLPFIFQVPDNKISFMDPLYWKIQPYTIVPGIIDFKKHRGPLGLHVLVAFKKKNQIYEFKKGEPMCLCYTYNRSVLEMNKNLIASPLRLDKGRTFTHQWTKEIS